MSRRYNRFGFDDPSVILSGGPSHSRSAEDADPPYEPPRQPLGFAAHGESGLNKIPAVVAEPLLWDGDQA